MAEKYLSYEGLQHLVEKLNQKYAPIKAIVFKGTVANIEALPALAGVEPGWMYNVTTGGGTTSDFIEGAGHILSDGENVAAVELITGYTAVATPTVDNDPKALGWYELDGTDYVLSQDRIAVLTKTYYTADTVKKWDILGGLFDLENRYLEFGEEFPETPVDGRTFLYMGEDTFVYNEVTSPEGRPVDNGYFEEKFDAVTPVGTENPKEEGWYEFDGTNYTLSTDETVDSSKTYYAKSYVASTDTTVDPAKTYFTKDSEYKKAVIYKYNATDTAWEAQSAGGSGDMIAITNKEIDELFI